MVPMKGLKCKKCGSNNLINKGLRGKARRLKCKDCACNFQNRYLYKHYSKQDDYQLKLLNAEGVGIRSMSRIMGYSTGTILRRIHYLKSIITKPIYCETNQQYEVDEIWTYVGKNKPSNYVWITYAINKKTRNVIDVVIGNRNKENLGKIINSLKALNPKKICTDRLNSYPNLIKPIGHEIKPHSTNRIERANLTLRTHIKRLTRKTICYSKSLEMLRACILIYLDFKYWKIS